MLDLVKKAKEFKMSRRAFVGWSSAIAATAAVPVTRGLIVKASANESSSDSMDEGKWVSAACWHNCGGRCLNKVLVKDGVVIRQKTDDTHEDSPDFPQQRGCLRGRSQRQQVFGADRLRYPMKRKHWEPGGGKKELRGKDEWIRISWDEALDIAASEIKRIKDKYGNRSILSTARDVPRLLNLYGGTTTHFSTGSYGTWYFTADTVGIEKFGGGLNDRLDIRNTQLFVLWACNPAWSSLGNPTYNFLQAKKAGAKFIIVDPMYSHTVEVLGDEWLPIRPGTDHAMMLGMAYTLITEDEPNENPLIDWDFLHRCTIGFDKEHMPEGVDPKGNFKNYVLGTYDGTPKTPEWASEICGLEPNRIRKLAIEIGSTSKVALLTGWASARVQNQDSLPQMLMTLGAMTGHIGKSGSMTGASAHSAAGNGGPALVKPGSDGTPPPSANLVDDVLTGSEMWDAIIRGTYRAGYNDDRDITIQLIYHGYDASLQTIEGTNSGIKAHRQVEFVISHAQFLTTNAKYSDLVLPVTTEWETEGGLLTGNREALFYYSKVVDPLFESKTDKWIYIEIAKRLGIDSEKLFGNLSDKQMLFNKLAGSTVINKEGTAYQPLLTITNSDIKEWGVEGIPQQGLIPLKEFQEKGVYQVPRKQGDNHHYIAMKEFRDDPEKNPRPTESGKMEIYSETLAKLIKGFGFTEIEPIPTYKAPVESYEATFENWDKQQKGEYPLQVINPHYYRRSHSVFDNVPQLREVWANPVYINTKDAKDRGISTNDTVLIKSKHGETLRPVLVTETIMPGVIALPHGAWAEIDEKSGIDKAGADNIICGQVPTGQRISGWNSCIAEVRKWDGETLTEDAKWEPRVIDYK